MNQSLIDQIKSYGFDVYMKDPKDTWLYFTNGTSIGYVQDDRISGISFSTVHKPNSQTGTGFRLDDGFTNVSKDELEKCFQVPQWASVRDRAMTKPYENIEAFINADDFNKQYKKV